MGLFGRIKAKFIGSQSPFADGPLFVNDGNYKSIMVLLITAQTSLRFETVRDSFPIFMDDQKAAGYLFGSHDALSQYFWGRNAKKCFPEIIESYKCLFGDKNGDSLFLKSAQSLEAPKFGSGRAQGGTEMFAYLEQGIRPLGLMNYLSFEFKYGKSSKSLRKFEQEISSWDKEQGLIAITILASMMQGNNKPVELVFGAGTLIRNLRKRLTIGQWETMGLALDEITSELGIDFDDLQYSPPD